MNTVKNVVVVYDYASINGGAAKVAIQSAMALALKGLNVHYFAACGPVDDRLARSNVHVKCLGIDDINHGNRLMAMKRGVWNGAVYQALKAYLGAFSAKDTIVHVHGWAKALSSAAVKAARDLGFGTVVTLHDYFTICPNGGLYDYRKQALCVKSPMSPGCILCNCDKRNYAQKLWRCTRQLVQDKYVRGNASIGFISLSELSEKLIRPYVKSKEFYRVVNPIPDCDRHAGDCTKSDVFLYVGRISEEKGAELFCKAITRLKKSTQIQGIVVGDGPLLKELKDAYPEVRFEGWKSEAEVSSYMQRARALILPSKWYEVAPLTILEAASMGLPAIVSDSTTGTEIIKDGVNGFVFHSNDPQSLADKITEAMDDDALRGIQDRLASEFDASAYSLAGHADALLDVYNAHLAVRNVLALKLY